MKVILNLCRFIGSVTFALLLIGTTALFVVAGTLLESTTESHGFAAYFTYGNPFFTSLLLLFFINILVSALRRFPFRPKHIPFLITHLGLLLLFAGAMSKSIWGTQGTMGILEGGSSQQIFIPNSYVLHIEKRISSNPISTFIQYLPIYKTDGNSPTFYLKKNSLDSDMKITLLESSPNTSEKMETWIKGDSLFINGIPTFPIFEGDFLEETHALPISGQAALFPEPSPSWEMMAFRSDQVSKLAQKAYLQGLDLILIDNQTKKTIFQAPLKSLLDFSTSIPQGSLTASLQWNYSLLQGFKEPAVSIKIALTHLPETTLLVPLDGAESLLNKNQTEPLRGAFPLAIELKRTPRLVFIQDNQGDDQLFAFDDYGRVFHQSFRPDTLSSLIAYDRGFGGYAIPYTAPIFAQNQGRQEKEASQFKQLSDQLKQAVQTNVPLSPPLELLRKACERSQQDFVETCMDFLHEWHLSYNWFYPEEGSLSPPVTKMMDHIEAPLSATQKAYWISRALRMQGVYLSHLLPLPKEEENGTPLALETPLSLKHNAVPLTTKWEDRFPLLILKFEKGDQIEILPLSYDPFGNGLKWPLFQGEYLVRFQPRFQKIPYRIRLRDARQINYPHSSQPFSYESDLFITDQRTKPQKTIEATISMNHVFQTWDGFRFYLANVTPGEEISPQRIQLIVNHDPMKYYLTYPGGVLLGVGIILLFWLQPKGKERRNKEEGKDLRT